MKKNSFILGPQSFQLLSQLGFGWHEDMRQGPWNSAWMMSNLQSGCMWSLLINWKKAPTWLIIPFYPWLAGEGGFFQCLLWVLNNGAEVEGSTSFGLMEHPISSNSLKDSHTPRSIRPKADEALITPWKDKLISCPLCLPKKLIIYLFIGWFHTQLLNLVIQKN